MIFSSFLLTTNCKAHSHATKRAREGGLEIQDMNTEELLEYYRNRKTLHPTVAKIKQEESSK